MKRKVLLMIIVIQCFSWTARAAELHVQSCSDGDTCHVQASGLALKVRLAAIDAPEIGRKGKTSQPFARESRDRLNQLVSGKKVTFTQYGIDAYNRPLVEITRVEDTDTNVNLILVKEGLAEIYSGRTPVDLKPYHDVQNAAKSQQKGIWSLGSGYESPYRYRKKR